MTGKLKPTEELRRQNITGREKGGESAVPLRCPGKGALTWRHSTSRGSRGLRETCGGRTDWTGGTMSCRESLRFWSPLSPSKGNSWWAALVQAPTTSLERGLSRMPFQGQLTESGPQSVRLGMASLQGSRCHSLTVTGCEREPWSRSGLESGP